MSPRDELAEERRYYNNLRVLKEFHQQSLDELERQERLAKMRIERLGGKPKRESKAHLSPKDEIRFTTKPSR